MNSLVTVKGDPKQGLRHSHTAQLLPAAADDLYVRHADRDNVMVHLMVACVHQGRSGKPIGTSHVLLRLHQPRCALCTIFSLLMAYSENVPVFLTVVYLASCPIPSTAASSRPLVLRAVQALFGDVPGPDQPPFPTVAEVTAWALQERLDRPIVAASMLSKPAAEQPTPLTGEPPTEANQCSAAATIFRQRNLDMHWLEGGRSGSAAFLRQSGLVQQHWGRDTEYPRWAVVLAECC